MKPPEISARLTGHAGMAIIVSNHDEGDECMLKQMKAAIFDMDGTLLD